MGSTFQRLAIIPAFILCSAFVARLAVDPDVKYESTTEVKLGGTAGTALKLLGLSKPLKSTTMLKGNVLRIDEDETSEIIDLDREVFITLDHDKKEFSVQTFEEWKAQWQETMGEVESGAEPEGEEVEEDEASNVVTKVDGSIEETGNTKKIEGHECREVVVRLTIEGQDTVTGETNTLITTSNIWLAEDLEGYREVQDFYRRLTEKLGQPWKLSVATLAETLAQASPEASAALEQLQERSKDLEGTPLLTTTKIEAASTGGEAEEDEEKEEGGGLFNTKKVSGLLGKKEKEEGPKMILESKTTMTDYSTDALSEELFQVPAEYEEVEEG
jgi:hypothetical protein